MITPTTDDIGTAIRDALDLLEGVDLQAATEDAEGHIPAALIDWIDDSDLSNLRIVIGRTVFVVRVVKEV